MGSLEMLEHELDLPLLAMNSFTRCEQIIWEANCETRWTTKRFRNPSYSQDTAPPSRLVLYSKSNANDLAKRGEVQQNGPAGYLQNQIHEEHC